MPPTEQRALTVSAQGAPFTLETRGVPKPQAGELLVKIHSTALNPVDRYMQEFGLFVDKWPFVCGCDASGVVEEIGDGVQGFALGDRVLFGGAFELNGNTFQEYALTIAVNTAKIPANLSFEEASTVPLGLTTAAMGYYAPLKERGGASLTPLWEEGGRGKYQGEPAFVVGGASSVGQYAIQVAKLSGFSPIITTASGHNKAYCEAAGATHVIDYHETPYGPPLISAVKSIIGSTPLKIIFDSISIPASQTSCWPLLSPGGKLIITLQPAPEVGEPGKETEDGKRTVWVFGSVKENVMGDWKTVRNLFAKLEELLRDGDVKPNKVEVLPGGLNGVAEGVRRFGEGKVSGVKMVARIGDTL